MSKEDEPLKRENENEIFRMWFNSTDEVFYHRVVSIIEYCGAQGVGVNNAISLLLSAFREGRWLSVNYYTGGFDYLLNEVPKDEGVFIPLLKETPSYINTTSLIDPKNLFAVLYGDKIQSRIKVLEHKREVESSLRIAGAPEYLKEFCGEVSRDLEMKGFWKDKTGKRVVLEISDRIPKEEIDALNYFKLSDYIISDEPEVEKPVVSAERQSPIEIEESRTEKLIMQMFDASGNKGSAFRTEKDYSDYVNLLTAFFESREYLIPKTIISLKIGRKTSIAKVLREIHKELSEKNLRGDNDYFRIIRVLSPFDKMTDNDLYKALTV